MARYRRYLIAAGILLVLVGAYAVGGFWGVPHFGRSAAQNFVKTHYGRTLSIGDIRFNPFTLKLDISDLSLPDADGKTLLGFGHLHVDLQMASLWRLGPSFSEILLDKLYVRAVIRRDGELNLADLGKGFPEEPKRAAAGAIQAHAPVHRAFRDQRRQQYLRGPDAGGALQGGPQPDQFRVAQFQHGRRPQQRLRAE